MMAASRENKSVRRGGASERESQGLRARGTKVKRFQAVARFAFEANGTDGVTANEIPSLLQAIDSHAGDVIIKAVLKLLPLTLLRRNELLGAKWAEVDFAEAVWSIPPERMKIRSPHFVPLSKQSLAILKELHAVTGSQEQIFPRAGGSVGHVGDGALLTALRKIASRRSIAIHSFRRLAVAVLSEQGHDRELVVEQLARRQGEGEGRRSLDVTERHSRRVSMMQDWADYLESVARTEKE